MNGRKAKQVRHVMDMIRKSPPTENVKTVVEAERERREHLLKRGPLGYGMCWLHKPRYVNPTRGIKNLAKLIVSH